MAGQAYHFLLAKAFPRHERVGQLVVDRFSVIGTSKGCIIGRIGRIWIEFGYTLIKRVGGRDGQSGMCAGQLS